MFNIFEDELKTFDDLLEEAESQDSKETISTIKIKRNRMRIAKEMYKKNGDYIWWTLCAISMGLGVFVDLNYGMSIILLIGIHFYLLFGDQIDRYFTQFDRLGVSFIAILFHTFVYFFIVLVVTNAIDKTEIVTSNSYQVKYLENEKIVISKNNRAEIIGDPRLYWECVAKNCKNIVITRIKSVPANPIFSEDLPGRDYIVYSAE